MSNAASKRPRLSLQTKSIPAPHIRATKATLKADTDPKSPTAFNTLSNVYVTAIERSTPVTGAQELPKPRVRMAAPLKLQTNPDVLHRIQTRTQTPFTATYPDTPLSANPMSPQQQMEVVFPSVITSTPPLSAGPMDPNGPKPFSFAPSEVPAAMVPLSPVRRRATFTHPAVKPPYAHIRGLHSILRNSPLPPPSVISPISPRRSVRLMEKTGRRVDYDSPIEQTITTELYTRSHIDLLAEDASPYTPSPAVEDADTMLDLAMAYSGDETRDGGMTPGPFEEMRRRMAGLATETPIASPRPDGIRKRKRKEKKRTWVWTIGQDDDPEESGALAALRATAPAEGTTATPMTALPSPGRLVIPTKATTPEPQTAILKAATPEPQTAILKASTPEPMTAIYKASTPEPQTAIRIRISTPERLPSVPPMPTIESIETTESESDLNSEEMEIEMSDTSSVMTHSRATTPFSIESDLKSPSLALVTRLGSVDSLLAVRPSVEDSRRATPVPDLVMADSQ